MYHALPQKLNSCTFVKFLFLFSSCDKISHWMKLNNISVYSETIADDCHSCKQKLLFWLCDRIHRAEVHQVNGIHCAN